MGPATLLFAIAALAPATTATPVDICEIAEQAPANISLEIEAAFVTDGLHGMYLTDSRCPREALVPVMSLGGGEGEISDPLIKAYWSARMAGRSPAFRVRMRGRLEDPGKSRRLRFIVEGIPDFIEIPLDQASPAFHVP
jgi:hypothetical protein